MSRVTVSVSAAPLRLRAKRSNQPCRLLAPPRMKIERRISCVVPSPPLSNSPPRGGKGLSPLACWERAKVRVLIILLYFRNNDKEGVSGERRFHCEERQRRGNVVVLSSYVALDHPRAERFESTLTDQGATLRSLAQVQSSESQIPS